MIKILLFFIFSILLWGCEDIHQAVPGVPVNIIMDANTDLANLGVGSTMVCPKSGGYMGILLYRSSLSEYHAFERTCTYYPNDTSAVVAKDGGVIAVCPKCGSTFILTADGALVNKGPARLPLVQYRTYLDPMGRLYISN
jgi:nitrite reductase/ring-hydroxylating ferredoxin subunit